METLHITKIVKVGNSLALVVPKEILSALNWERGDIVVFGCVNQNHLLVRRASDFEIQGLKPQEIINLI